MAENSIHELHNILNFVRSKIKIKPAVLAKIISQNNHTRLLRLVQCVEKKMTEKEALAAIYGNTRHTATYRSLKRELKNKLLNLVFMSDNELGFKNPYYKTLYRLKRNIAAAEFFRLKDMRKTAMSLLRAAFETAVRYHETADAVRCGKLLCEDSAYQGKDKKKLVHYQAKTAAQERLLVQESALQALYHTVLFYAAKSSDYSNEVLEEIEQKFKAAQLIYNRHPGAYYILLHFTRIAVLYYQSRNEHANVISQCKKFAACLRKFSHLYQDAMYGEFALCEMDSHARLGQFRQGWRCAQRCLNHFIPHSSTWIQFHGYYFLFAMRTGNVNEAQKIHHAVRSSSKFASLPALQHERWHIYEAFLYFALENEPQKKKQFNVFKFLNDLPLTTHDKPGFNFTVCLAQIILLINLGDREKLVDLEYSFRRYHSRYIKKEKYPRHYYFGCIVRQLLKNDFNYEDDKIKIFLMRLKENKNNAQSLEETEIIPYETLWRMMKKKIFDYAIISMAA
ncbi:MAG: hypothetical protein ABI855_10030 [Bacteroidota bacterium]